ncbi:MAG: VPGUxxT family thioredoxin-like (seleno)protein, type 2 [Gammaproteobacteria bacterium]
MNASLESSHYDPARNPSHARHGPGFTGQLGINRETEPGRVHWSRDLDAALARARHDSTPLFLLFQEIPGCGTCTGFGKNVLSHPLLVAAIEDCFVPVVVRNNVEGEEARILKRFDEPAWNNPVVRFLDADGKDLVPRQDRIWDTPGIARRMIAALEAARAPVPGYLLIAHDESDPYTETALFSMHCFWEGEARLAAIPGVVATRAGFVKSAEVVEATFLPLVVSRDDLTERAQQAGCNPVPGTRFRPAPAHDQ